MTDCGPAPAMPAVWTVVPVAASEPDHDPSAWRVKVTCVPAGRPCSTSPFLGTASAVALLLFDKLAHAIGTARLLELRQPLGTILDGVVLNSC